MRCENYFGGQSAESTAASVMKLAHSSSFSMEQNHFWININSFYFAIKGGGAFALEIGLVFSENWIFLDIYVK